MRKLITLILAVALLGFFFSSVVPLEASPSVSVSYNVTGFFDDGTPGGWSNQTNQTANRGTTLSVSIPTGQALAFGVVNGVVRPDFNLDTYTLTSQNDIELVFHPTDPLKYAVAFVDSNGALIGVTYTPGGEVSGIDTSTVMGRPGYDIDTTNKWISVYGSPSLASISEHSVFALNYKVSEVSAKDNVTIEVTGGTANPTGSVPFNSVITASANEPGIGQYFVGWYEGSTLLSYHQTYVFTALYDRTIKATFAATPVVPTALITISDTMVARANHYTYAGKFELIAGQTLVEYGFIYHDTSNVADITFATENIKVAQASNRNQFTNEFVMSFALNSHYSIRAYAIYVQNDTLHTIYSENTIFRQTALEVDYLDFEGQTKGSYASSTVIIDGKSWILSDSVIGNLENDRKFGIKSLRLQANGFIASDFYYEKGIDNLRFHYAKYGSDANSNITIQYAYAWAPNNWISVMSGETPLVIPVTSTDLNVALVSISINQPIYVRINRGDGGNRINIDNIIVNYVNYVDNVLPEINGTQNLTITEGDDLNPLTGVTARDIIDGNLTEALSYILRDSVSNIIDPVVFTTLSEGSYTIQYVVEDSSGNTATVTVSLTVNSESQIPTEFSYTLTVGRTGLTNTTYQAINITETNGVWTGSTNKTGENMGTNATNNITFTAASGYYIHSIRMVVISASGTARSITGNEQTLIAAVTSASPVDSGVVILNGSPTTITLVPSGALQYQYITVVVRPNP